MKFALLIVVVAGCALEAGKNKCVEQTDCLDGYSCINNTCEMVSTCTPATCAADQCSMVSDGCGGLLDCGGCGAGEVCGANTHTCAPQPEHCSNGQRDGLESDVDCGGDCAACPNGKRCNGQSDCETGTCEGNVCLGGRWTSVAPMPTARTGAGAVVTPDGLIYVIGGYRSGGLTGVVEVFNPTTNSWGTRAPMPTPRDDFAAVLGSDNLIYTIGGHYNSSVFPYEDGNSIKVEAYNPATNTWTAKPSLPNGRSRPAAVTATNGKIYVTGGYSVGPEETLSSVISYTPGAASWTAVSASMTNVRTGHGSVTTADGRIYAVAGYDGDNELNTFEYYVPGAISWATLPMIPTARKYTAAALAGGKLYVIGGSAWLSASVAYSKANEMYDPATNTWTKAPSMPLGRFDHALVTGIDGRIYAIGGSAGGTPSMTNVVDVFTPE